jgi:ornithine carbamoyltransferase
MKYQTRHLLTGAELSPSELNGLIDLGDQLREERKRGELRTDLKGKTLVLLFEKPSLRTHLSFTVAMQELGGTVIESFSLNRKKEEPEDVARVVGGYAHGIMVRTHEHSILERMITKSPAQVINGLSDSHHPCQIFADLLTLKQYFGKLKGLELAYIGDGNNILHSLLLLLPLAGVSVKYACPRGYEPNALILKQAQKLAKETGAKIKACATPTEAAKGVNALYTDVWTSMGFEGEESQREEAFDGYQINAELLALAAPNAIIMHCLPMIRGKEITDEMADHEQSAIFRQSENRLHAQKALLLGLLGTSGN